MSFDDEGYYVDDEGDDLWFAAGMAHAAAAAALATQAFNQVYVEGAEHPEMPRTPVVAPPVRVTPSKKFKVNKPDVLEMSMWFTLLAGYMLMRDVGMGRMQARRDSATNIEVVAYAAEKQRQAKQKIERNAR